MILVPDWYNKSMNTMVFALNNELSKDTGMCTEDT